MPRKPEPLSSPLETQASKQETTEAKGSSQKPQHSKRPAPALKPWMYEAIPLMVRQNLSFREAAAH
jgi:hypothetical protein